MHLVTGAHILYELKKRNVMIKHTNTFFRMGNQSKEKPDRISLDNTEKMIFWKIIRETEGGKVRTDFISINCLFI